MFLRFSFLPLNLYDTLINTKVIKDLLNRWCRVLNHNSDFNIVITFIAVLHGNANYHSWFCSFHRSTGF